MTRVEVRAGSTSRAICDVSSGDRVAKRAAVRVFDDRGIKSLRIVEVIA